MKVELHVFEIVEVWVDGYEFELKMAQVEDSTISPKMNLTGLEK